MIRRTHLVAIFVVAFSLGIGLAMLFQTSNPTNAKDMRSTDVDSSIEGKSVQNTSLGSDESEPDHRRDFQHDEPQTVSDDSPEVAQRNQHADESAAVEGSRDQGEPRDNDGSSESEWLDRVSVDVLQDDLNLLIHVLADESRSSEDRTYALRYFERVRGDAVSEEQMMSLVSSMEDLALDTLASRRSGTSTFSQGAVRSLLQSPPLRHFDRRGKEIQIESGLATLLYEWIEEDNSLYGPPAARGLRTLTYDRSVERDVVQRAAQRASIPDVRRAALAALTEIGTQDEIAALEGIASTDRDEYIRFLAQQAIESIKARESRNR